MFKRTSIPTTSAILLCLVMLGGCSPAEEGGSGVIGTPDVTSISSDANVTNVSYQPGETITINVPDMNCPFYCFPKVKETLTELGGIKKMELVTQKEEDKIDDPRIVIELSEEFNWATASQALKEVGFGGATVVSKN